MAVKKSIVLCFSGHDASGGAGIQADIEAIASLGCHACTIVTALTAQNTSDVKAVYPVDASIIQNSVDVLLNDVKPDAIKIGLIGSLEALNIIVKTIEIFPTIPVVLDPIFSSGSGNAELATEKLIHAVKTELLPLVTLVTPNVPELFKLSDEQIDQSKAPQTLNAIGADYVFVKGTHSQTDKVHNELHFNQRLLDVVSVRRLSGSYHGSGCTLAATISAMLASGLDPLHACKEAVDFTFLSLEHSFKIGQGRSIPNRIFWADEE